MEIFSLNPWLKRFGFLSSRQYSSFAKKQKSNFLSWEICQFVIIILQFRSIRNDHVWNNNNNQQYISAFVIILTALKKILTLKWIYLQLIHSFHNFSMNSIYNTQNYLMFSQGSSVNSSDWKYNAIILGYQLFSFKTKQNCSNKHEFLIGIN